MKKTIQSEVHEQRNPLAVLGRFFSSEKLESKMSAAPFHRRSFPRAAAGRAFTLVELLCVVAVMGMLVFLAVPALNSLKGAGNVTSSAYEIAAALQRARSYAMTHNTYVWVGFYEEAANASTVTASAPPYQGNGHVILGTVASLDGTSVFDDNASPAQLTSLNVAPIGKMVQLENVHLTDIGAPSGGSTPLDQRPDGAYVNSPGDEYRISSDSSDATPYPVVIGSYTFYKTIRFSPDGEASIDGVSELRPVGEIGLVPTHGSIVEADARNAAAIQFSGIGGNVQIYRR